MTRPWKIVPLLLVPLALAASIAIPLVAEEKQLLLISVALVGAAGAALLLFNPPVGFAILIFSSQFVPFEIGTGTQTGVNVVVLLIAALAGAWLFDRLVIQHKLRWVRAKPIFPLLLFGAAAVLSFLGGQLRWFPVNGAPLRAQLGGLAIYLLSVTVYVIFAQQIRSVVWLKRLLWLFIATGAAYLFCTFYLGWLSSDLLARLSSVFPRGAGGSVFWIWLVVLPLGQIIFNHSLSIGWKAALVLLLAGAFYYRGVTTNEWTSGWVPPLAGAIAMLLLVDLRLTALFGLAGLVSAPFFGVQFFNRWIYAANQYSILTRVEAARIMLEIIKIAPVFGLGPANYYWYTPFYNIMGFFVPFNSHNNYLDLLAQTGVVSLVLLLWFLLSVTLQGLRLFRASQDGFRKGYAAACLAAIPALLASMMLGDWVIPFTYNIGLSGFRSSFLTFLFLAGLVVIEAAARRAPAVKHEAQP